MPFTTTVIESYPERRSGFLENPAGGEKVYFDFEGWRKRGQHKTLVSANGDGKKFPPEGSKVEVIETHNSTTGFPKATLWRLVERGKRPSMEPAS